MFTGRYVLTQTLEGSQRIEALKVKKRQKAFGHHWKIVLTVDKALNIPEKPRGHLTLPYFLVIDQGGEANCYRPQSS